MNEICLSCRKHTKCGRAIHETIGCGYYVPQTNEEWLCSLSTEEKAEFLKKIIQSCGWCLDGGNPPFCLLSGNKCFFNDGEFVEWLKGEHHE